MESHGVNLRVCGRSGGTGGGDDGGGDGGGGDDGGGDGGDGGDDDGDGGDGGGGEPNLKKDNVVLPPKQFLSEGADPRMGLDLNEN